MLVANFWDLFRDFFQEYIVAFGTRKKWSMMNILLVVSTRKLVGISDKPGFLEKQKLAKAFCKNNCNKLVRFETSIAPSLHLLPQSFGDKSSNLAFFGAIFWSCNLTQECVL